MIDVVLLLLAADKPEGPLPGDPPPGCRPVDEVLEQLRPSFEAFGACLAGAQLSPSGPSITVAPDGSVSARSGTDDPARDACVAEAVGALELPPLPPEEQCTLVLSWPLSVDPRP